MGQLPSIGGSRCRPKSGLQILQSLLEATKKNPPNSGMHPLVGSIRLAVSLNPVQGGLLCQTMAKASNSKMLGFRVYISSCLHNPSYTSRVPKP